MSGRMHGEILERQLTVQDRRARRIQRAGVAGIMGKAMVSPGTVACLAGEASFQVKLPLGRLVRTYVCT